MTIYSHSPFRAVASDATRCYCTGDAHKCTERKINKILRVVTEISERLKERNNAAPASETPDPVEKQVFSAATTPEELDALASSENIVSLSTCVAIIKQTKI